MAWTSVETLLVVSDDGTYRLYDLSGEYKQYSLGADVNEAGILSCRIHEEGFVVLTGLMQLVQVRGWEGARPSSLAPISETLSLL